MQDDTKLLLRECGSGCKMAINSMKQVLSELDDEELQKLISDSLKRHEELEAETAEHLSEHGAEEKDPGIMASTFSYLSTEMKMLLHKGDSKEAAKIMMDGCHMGIEALAKKVNEYKNAEKVATEIAEKIIKEEEDFMQNLKGFL